MLLNSEFILNHDQTIYHLHLKPEQIATTIITVGDPNRVADVSKHFDTIEHQVAYREFHTHTGTYNGKKISVISTGIGTDNIDIVLNEIDALHNINFITRKPYRNSISLDIVRIGTSGAIQSKVPLNSFVISESAIGIDGMLHFYNSKKIQDRTVANVFMNHMDWDIDLAKPYVVQCNQTLLKHLQSSKTIANGVTLTSTGFYAPQGRNLRTKAMDPDFLKKLITFSYDDKAITNIEMETAGIYGLAKLMGHRALSMNAILAKRNSKRFSKNPEETVERLIKYTLKKLVEFEGPKERKRNLKIEQDDS